jgi:putative ABC transport system substrate-binding protein
MRRRGFITFLGGAIAWPFAADAQKTAIPVIGYFSSRSAETEAALRTPFLKGLADAGFVVGKNVLVEYRFAEGQYDQLKELAADLVRRQISVLVATDRFAALNALDAIVNGKTHGVGNPLRSSLVDWSGEYSVDFFWGGRGNSIGHVLFSS